jgi:hypothetical protein
VLLSVLQAVKEASKLNYRVLHLARNLRAAAPSS